MSLPTGLQTGLAGCLWLVCSAGAQDRRDLAAPVPMPADRITDSYLIYSQLLPGNEIEWGDAQRTEWLVEDVTNAEPLSSACSNDGVMNPHTSVKPPEARRAEFNEVLADFDAHCHERYQLDAGGFRLKLPLRLLDEDGRHRFTEGVVHYRPPSNDIMRAPATPDEFKGAAGLHRFTAVYFNRAHTLALTEIGMYCGSLCGNWTWVALERTPEGWRVLPWVHTFTIS